MDDRSACPPPEALEAFAGGRLTSAEARGVEAHVQQCAGCAAALPQSLANSGGPTLYLGPRNSQPPRVSGSVTPAELSPAAPQTLCFSFLQAGQAADEIGRLANYRVLRLMGQGGMGMVFHAEDLTLGRPVALKVMNPDLDITLEPSQRFLREARTVASIKHPNVVTIFQVGQEGKLVWLAMEFLEGRTLDAWMRSGRWPTLAEILRLGREIASGLAAIHRHGLIHRDIKPANLWLEEPDGHVKILDFGLARPATGDTHLTSSGVVVGTPAFMSPEQARGDRVDARSDLFSLGCVLYALCTGSEPFSGQTPMARIIAQAVADPPPIREKNPTIPAALAELVMRLLAKDPAGRPASCAEVVAQLEQIEQTLPDAPTRPLPAKSGTSAWPKLPPDGASTRFSRRRMALGAAMLLLSVIGLAGAGIARLMSRPAAATPVYLSDVRPADSLDWMVHPPRPPAPGSRGPQGPDDDTPLPPGDVVSTLRIRGEPSPHGVFMHASPRGLTYVSYRLDQPFARFVADVSLNDSAPDSPLPLAFAVYGDDRLLWKSKEVQSQADRQNCSVDVTGVKVLKLAVHTEGDERGAHGAWIEPRLLRQ